jgi:DNA repair exonuclease SbcCD nuclease subunit
VELCIQEQARLLVLAGDLFDDDWRDYSTGLFFLKQMKRLREAEVEVVWIRGNHDAASKITRQLKMPEKVYELPVRRPKTIEFDALGIAVHGQGFPQREVTEDLTVNYPAPVPGALNVGLLHTSVDGRPGHDTYAPCRLETLVAKGYAYWALGHVHRREVLHESPWVVFPGNLQGRHARETGPKGATLVTVEGGAMVSVEHRSLDAVRWQVCEVDSRGASNADEVLELTRAKLEKAAEEADGRLLAARIVLTGTTRAHAALAGEWERWVEQFRALGFEIRAGDVWIERVELQTQTHLDLDRLAKREDALGQLVRSLRELRGDDATLELLREEFSDLRGKLGDLERVGRDFGLSGPEGMRAWIDRIEQRLVPRLLSEEDSGG